MMSMISMRMRRNHYYVNHPLKWYLLLVSMLCWRYDFVMGANDHDDDDG